MNEQKKNEFKEFLMEQDVLDTEVDELLEQFSNNVTKEDLQIVTIFDSARCLAENYIINVVGELDHHIEAVLDYTKLGKHIADFGDEYVILGNGRIVQFEL